MIKVKHIEYKHFSLCAQDISSSRGAVSDVGMEALACACKQLRSLDIAGSAISDKVCPGLSILQVPMSISRSRKP